MKRQIYLNNLPLSEALMVWEDKLKENNLLMPLEGEEMPVWSSHGRVTAEAVFAHISSPFYHCSAMDGYAVRFIDTFGASETSPKILKIGKQAAAVDTGDPMPDGFNAVLMIEDVNKVSDDEIEIIKPATPWQYVRTIGEDIVATELILPENHKVMPVDMGAMLAGGITSVFVRRRPKIVIIPTGTELIEAGAELKKGDIIEYNSAILCGMAEECGAEAIHWAIVPDDFGLLKTNILKALDAGDMVVVNAGSSAGSEDFTVHAIRELGEVFVHGTNIKPGKPVILGMIKGKPVVGIPGYPVSAVLTFKLFVKPIIFKWQGMCQPAAENLTAKLSRQVASPLGQEEFVRVKLGNVGGNIIATPIQRGAAVLMSLVRADGILRIPAASEGIAGGSGVEVELLRPKDEIVNTIVCIGSHDNALDILANILKKRHPHLSLSSAHVGSMGGLMALKRGEAHIAGTHLLDEGTGEYNAPFLKRLLPDKQIILINLVYREQGLIVQKGNPKGINGFKDLTREDITFINRQNGSGTRLLLDKYLKDLSINPDNINGYDRDEYTHMGVAAGVRSGAADAGMGILAAATALGLDFIPVAKERYDIAIPLEFYSLQMIQCLIDIIRNDKEFKEAVLSLGGYDVSDTGKVMYENY
ncbi:MAG: molybdopterin biosynthesis protein [Nitrospirae bacterium]|nr:molybdopterin biosynthesis protein [Nitrospirota bacterium]